MRRHGFVMAPDGQRPTIHARADQLLRGSIYAQQILHGIYKLESDKLLPLTSRQAVGDDVVAILPWGDKTVLCTVRHGLFLLEGNKVRPFHTDIDKKLQLKESDDLVAFLVDFK